MHRPALRVLPGVHAFINRPFSPPAPVYTTAVCKQPHFKMPISQGRNHSCHNIRKQNKLNAAKTEDRTIVGISFGQGEKKEWREGGKKEKKKAERTS